MLLCPIQKTANFQHNGDNALNAHLLVVPLRYGFLVGLVSCKLCGHGSASESTGCESPPHFLLWHLIHAILHTALELFYSDKGLDKYVSKK